MPKIVLNEWVQKLREEKGIEIEAGDETFVIDPAELWSEKAFDAINGRHGTEDSNRVAWLKALWGKAKYDRFVKAGGNDRIADTIFGEVNEVTPGE